MPRETILVVDDNHQLADFTACVLLPDMGYEALIAYNGESALETIRKTSPALMILDLQLPDMTGLDLLRTLARESHPIPTILVTAHGSEQVAVDAFRLGVQDYLSKPVDPDSLNAAITRALSESRLRREKDYLTHQLQERVTWLTALAKVGQLVTSTLELDEVLRRIVEASVLLTRAEEGFLALLDETSNQLYLRAVKNIEQEKSKSIRLLVNDPLVSRVFRTGAPVRTSQESEGRPLKVSTGFLVHSLLYVPLISKGKTLGVLAVANRGSRSPFTENDEALLVSLADYATIAIENARLYEQAQKDIVERKRVELTLRETEERYSLAVRGANDGLWDWDLKTQKVYYSTRWKAMFGYKEEEISNKADEWFGRMHPDDIERVRLDISGHLKGITSHFESEHRIRHKDGDYRWVLCRGCAVWDPNGKPTRIAGSLTDITDRKSSEERLVYDAFHDKLTGLPNRALFIDRLRYAVERAKRRSAYLFAVLFLDLDRFKDINDSLGHLVGDRVLNEVARRMERILRPTDTIARFGGDEFVILLEDINDLVDATRVANRVQKEMAIPFQLEAQEVFVTASLGIVLSSTGYLKPEDVLRDADIAMYRAKDQGRARFEVFDPAMRSRIMQRLALESDLRAALEHQEFRIFYQPIFNLQTGLLSGFEAQLRWQHPTRGLLTSAEFLELAEETGLAFQIDRWVLRQACQQIQSWQKQFQYTPPLMLSVNLAGKHIIQAELGQYVEQILAETGLAANCLKLAIPEKTIIELGVQANDVLTRLQTLGAQIQIADFGVGYVSLGHLLDAMLHSLKVNRAFINSMEQGEIEQRIVQALIMVTRSLQIAAIAEGVKTQSQLTRLKNIGCEFAQGAYLAPSMEAEQIKLLLERSAGKITE